MADYTPTTEEVRSGYSEYGLGDGSEVDPNLIRAERAAEFDAWLNSVKAEAWEEGKQTWNSWFNSMAPEFPDNPYRIAEETSGD